jgi:hypothetical protein
VVRPIGVNLSGQLTLLTKLATLLFWFLILADSGIQIIDRLSFPLIGTKALISNESEACLGHRVFVVASSTFDAYWLRGAWQFLLLL